MSILLKIQALWDMTPCQMVVTDSRRSFQMLATTYQSTRRHIAEDVNLHEHRFKNFKSCKVQSCVYRQVCYDKADGHKIKTKKTDKSERYFCY